MIENLYGRHAVHEALRAGRRRFYKLILGANVKETGLIQDIVHLASKARCQIQRVEKQRLDRALPGVRHQGVLLETGVYPYVPLETMLETAEVLQEPPLMLLLDHLEDPQNLATLLRTAEAMGVQGVVIPQRRAAGVTPAVVNASAGAVEHLSVARVNNMSRSIDALKKGGLWVAGLEDRPDAQALARCDLTGPLAIVVGAEGKGLSRLVREKCDWLIRIPMMGRIQSLNAAVAGSVVLVAARTAREIGS
ncbi:MAG: 23S rRNA (guanosine(2251)-2'-O)-methyltransferase RlmB [Chloroflexota bacterium]|nr:23S rRNA (guanosine(2251)-2'-O)-methyltransferase RlmB [Chloroflexota bacterium]